MAADAALNSDEAFALPDINYDLRFNAKKIPGQSKADAINGKKETPKGCRKKPFG